MAVWLGFRVSGNAVPEAAKLVPDSDVELIVTAVVPVEDKTSICVAGAPTATSPKFTFVELRLRMGPPGRSCRVNGCDIPPALAVSVADCEELTGETDAEKLALVAPAATVTAAGTVTSELLLARLTLKPPLAAALSVTMQRSVPACAIELFVQFSELNTGTPVPLRVTKVELPVEESLMSVSCPDTAPAATGSNCTLRVVVWPGTRVTGTLPPEIVNPVPVSAAALTVTAELPVEVRVNDCVIVELTPTVPKARFDALMPSAGTEAPS